MKRSLMMVAASVGVGVVLVAAGSLGLTRRGRAPIAAVPRDVVRGGDPHIPASGTLDDLIASLQSRLKTVPNDHVAWATLGLAFVQQAKVTVDPTYYPRADAALAQSLKTGTDDNYLAYAGLSALASARHDFSNARNYANQGLAINPFSAILYGALSDAELQLGNYDAATISTQKMVDLSPDTASLSRASYIRELRGNVDEARSLMQRALDDAATASNRAFALVHLGGIAADQGDSAGALYHYALALSASPTDVAALAGKARAEAALGQVETALDDYAIVVARAPEPSYLVEYARLLESLGRTAAAEDQYRVVRATQKLFRANGVEPDASETLLEVDRGDISKALADADRGIATRPFLVMFDAKAWALHAAGRDTEAMAAIERAKSLGTRSALFEFHAGMIARSLGDNARARTSLMEALRINPTFDPLSAKIARDTLESMAVVS
jgi:tetratricopeptide (TPR) repeat protein